MCTEKSEVSLIKKHSQVAGLKKNAFAPLFHSRQQVHKDNRLFLRHRQYLGDCHPKGNAIGTVLVAGLENTRVHRVKRHRVVCMDQ